MACVGKSGCAGGLLDGLKGRTGRPDLTIPPDKEFLVESRMAVGLSRVSVEFLKRSALPTLSR